MSRFTGMMCVRDEEDWIGRSIHSLLPVCDRIYILDDHSEDRTKAIALAYEQVRLFPSPFEEGDRDEARDKTYLLNEITTRRASKPSDWVIYLDGDEELVAGDREKLLGTLEHKVDQYCVQILYLWNDGETVRVDGHYSKCYRPSIFRLVKHGMVFQNHSGRIHATGVPVDVGYSVRLHEPEPVRVLHYGYMEKEERERKFERYMKLDPVQEEFYRRECFGPAITAPLDSILRWNESHELRSIP